MRVRQVDSWVVYRMAPKGKTPGGNVVCEQGEWNALESACPGVHTLIHSGIATEAVAERLARGTSGDPVPRATRAAPLAVPIS